MSSPRTEPRIELPADRELLRQYQTQALQRLRGAATDTAQGMTDLADPQAWIRRHPLAFPGAAFVASAVIASGRLSRNTQATKNSHVSDRIDRDAAVGRAATEASVFGTIVGVIASALGRSIASLAIDKVGASAGVRSQAATGADEQPLP